jgi:diguanylate cyclase (GGDEF)-like protein
MKALLTPGILLAAVAVLLRTGLIPLGPALVMFAFYCALIAGLLLAWRFHSSRIFLALLSLFLGEQAIAYFSSVPASAQHSPAVIAMSAVGVLLPLNFVLLSFRQEKGFVFANIAPAAVVLFVESVIVAVMSRPESVQAAVRNPAMAVTLPFPVVLAFSAAVLTLLTRYFLFRKPFESGLLWSLMASLLALHFHGVGRIPSAYFATAAFILAGAVVETSYMLAYHDELTTLPSRRAFREALLRLEPPYAIAVADIDHFKRCNDTYGHDTGDQVLRLVASRMARVSGGGDAYRFGGEEFAIVFPGKTAAEVLEPLEKLRAAIETSRLKLRGPDRRQVERGTERRIQAVRGKGQAIRELTRTTKQPQEIGVTISIGVASAGKGMASPEDVIRAADKALYRAKAAGRNRVEVASGARPGFRRTTAGIA